MPHVGALTLRVARRNGLDLAGLLRGLGPGFGLDDLMPEGAAALAKDPIDLYAAATVGIDDMVANCVTDLVRPCLPDHPDPVRLAAGLLLAGRTMRGAVEAQAAWHEWAQLLARRTEAEAPRRNLSWPALFPPYRHDDGVTVRCLTRTPELVAEGAKGVDADGIAGLNHCVASYDHACAAGRTHVASVRIEGVRVVRLSTVQIQVEDRDLRLLAVTQHRALANAIPPGSAEAAVQALFRDVAEGLHPFDVLAATPRQAPSRDGGPFDPGAVFEAWRPLMVRRAARAGLPGLLAAAGAVPR